MKITILGAGVIGVTTAYLLAERGHEVEVIERQPQAAGETSHANGGQLSFAHAEPWANPLVLGKVFKWMFKKDAPLVLRPSLDPHQLCWTLSFLRNCLKDRCDANSVNLLRLGLYSKKVTEKIRVTSGVKFDNTRNGILHLYTSEKDLAHATEQAQFQNKFGGQTSLIMEPLSREGCLRKEPTLQYAERNIVGGVFATIDEGGDCGMFTQNLAEIATREFGVKFHYNTTVQKLETDKGRITRVVTDKGVHTADAYVMAAGSYSYPLLKKIGISVPVYPLKGYSLTVPAGDFPASVSITDNENKIVVTPLGNRLRAAGTAEFAGYNQQVVESRVAPILRATKTWFPKADYSESSIMKWACLRPATPDGLPIIGRSKVENLYLNTGHGTLGWTQAGGSANLLADIIDGRPTEIAMTGFGVDRL